MTKKQDREQMRKMQEAERIRRKAFEEGYTAGKRDGQKEIREKFRELMHLEMGSNEDYWP